MASPRYGRPRHRGGARLGDEPLGLSAWDVVKVVHEAGKAGLDALSFVYVAPRSDAISALVSYIVVYYLLASSSAAGRGADRTPAPRDVNESPAGREYREREGRPGESTPLAQA